MLRYKSLWNRKHLVEVDRFYPSTKLCGECWFPHPALTLSTRVWVCGDCGAAHDRDLNAAKNIRREGLRMMVAVGQAGTVNVRGADVRPPRPVAIGGEARIPLL